jgi:hypothetical protein
MDKDLLMSYVEEGFSTYKISKVLKKAPSTIRYWLNKYKLKTKNKSFKDGYHIGKDNIVDYFCNYCNLQLTKENSYSRNNRPGVLPFCKKCFSNRTKVKRKRNKEEAVEYMGGCCGKCGYNRNIATLEFHHSNPLEKEISPSKLINRKWSILKEELHKCVLLCSNCHKEEHQKIDDKIQLENSFKPHQLNNFSNSIMTGKNTFRTSCYICDIVITDENLASKKHTPICKSCNSKRLINLAKNGKKRVVEYMGGCCSACGYDKCIRALEFHHLDANKKSKNYNKNFKLWNFEKQKKELETCVLLCSNCHREAHNQYSFI